jgi:hypothetical protein
LIAPYLPERYQTSFNLTNIGKSGARFASTANRTVGYNLTEINFRPSVSLQATSSAFATGDGHMTFHKRILEWQAEHPATTWVFWIIVWTIAIVLIIWPRASW